MLAISIVAIAPEQGGRICADDAQDVGNSNYVHSGKDKQKKHRCVAMSASQEYDVSGTERDDCAGLTSRVQRERSNGGCRGLRGSWRNERDAPSAQGRQLRPQMVTDTSAGRAGHHVFEHRRQRPLTRAISAEPRNAGAVAAGGALLEILLLLSARR